MLRVLLLLLAFCLAAACAPARTARDDHAALVQRHCGPFSRHEDVHTFDGKIDARRTAAFLARAKDRSSDLLVINSAGGDVRAAAGLARWIGEGNIRLLVRGRCESACLEILAPFASAVHVCPRSRLSAHGGDPILADALRADGREDLAREIESAYQPAHALRAMRGLPRINEVSACASVFADPPRPGYAFRHTETAAPSIQPFRIVRLDTRRIHATAWRPTARALEAAGYPPVHGLDDRPPRAVLWISETFFAQPRISTRRSLSLEQTRICAEYGALVSSWQRP